MTASTLLVGLNELSLSQFSEVVTARGIDRVIVVASNTGFNSSELSNLTNSKVKTLSSAGVSFKLASDNGNKIYLSGADYKKLEDAGFDFITQDEFKSLTATTALVSGNLISSYSSSTSFPVFNTVGPNTVGNYITAVAANGINGFGSSQAVEISPGGFSALNDLNGSLQLNISAADFLSVLSAQFRLQKYLIRVT